MTFRLILFAVALATSARAGDAPARGPQEQASLQGFAAAHRECQEWSDGCATCKRDDAVHCSTPGIACQPREIACNAP